MYTYRVRAENLMGFGTLSSTFTYVPRHFPSKPPTPPTNVSASTDRNTIYIAYEALINGEDGGSDLSSYNIYMDDGMDGEFTQVDSQGTSFLTWNTATTLVTGNIYRLKYSGTNIHGEGPLSDEVQILVAEIPSAPTSLTRVDMEALAAGQIRITWALPADEGGDPVTGYLVYLDNDLYLDARGDPTLNEFTFTSLNVAQTYTIGVSSVNDIGEGPTATLSELAASVPMKLASPILELSTENSIKVSASSTSFNGGADISLYAFRRDDGPTTDFLEQIDSVLTSHTFTGLDTAQFYRFQVAAINSIG